MTKKLKTLKKGVFFIATKYKNEPAKVNFYTKGGELVSDNTVCRSETKETCISNNYYSFQ